MLRTSTRNLLLATCIAAAPTYALAQSPAQQKAQQNQAQQNQLAPQSTQRSASQMSGKFLAAPQSGQMRAADLREADIYTADNQKVGDIDDLLIDQRGNIVAVVVGVGGFLGIGEKNVAIPFDSLEIQNPNLTTASNMNGSRTTGATTTTNDRMTTGAVPNNATSQERERTTAQRAEEMGNQQANRQNDRAAPAQQQANQQRQTTTTTTTTQRTAQATTGMWKPDRILLKGLTKADLQNAPEFKWDESARASSNNTNAPARGR